MNQKTTENDPIMLAIKDYYERKDVVSALEKIDSFIVSKPMLIPFPYQLKADIFRDQGKIDEALQVIHSGLNIFPVSHDLLKRRAEIVGFYKGDLQSALQDIGKALVCFEGSSNNQMEFLREVDVKGNLDFFKSYTSTKVDLKILEQDLSRLNGLKFLNTKIDNVEKSLVDRLENNKKETEKEKIRNIELLGIFTAVLGFIFANVQKSVAISSFWELLLFDLALSVPLILFIFLIHQIFKK